MRAGKVVIAALGFEVNRKTPRHYAVNVNPRQVLREIKVMMMIRASCHKRLTDEPWAEMILLPFMRLTSSISDHESLLLRSPLMVQVSVGTRKEKMLPRHWLSFKKMRGAQIIINRL